MNLRGACVAVLALAATAAVQAAEPRRPNIVFIISDDQRWDTIGAAGNTKVHTPNVDRLAKEGTYFRQATVAVPQCSPVRASLLTGRLPHQTGWISNQYQDDRARGTTGLKPPFLPQVLRDGGYRTVLVGKWHLEMEPWDVGFSDVRTWLTGGGGPYENHKLSQGKSRDAKTREGFTNRIFGEDAAAFIKSPQAKEAPFFLWLALTAPHAPYKPNPPEVEKLYEGKSNDDLRPPAFPPSVPTHKSLKAYYEAVSTADQVTGQVMKALEDAGLSQDTAVVYMGDNGYMMGSHGVASSGAAGKVVPWDESVRVPLVVKAPAGAAPAKGTVDTPASSMDLPVTFAAWAGVDAPKEWNGRRLDRDLSKIDHAFVEWADNKSERFGDLAYRLVRTPTHKLIVWEKSDKAPTLYDLTKDPHEEKNVYDDLAYSQVRKDLSAKLADWVKRTDDPAAAWIDRK